MSGCYIPHRWTITDRFTKIGLGFIYLAFKFFWFANFGINHIFIDLSYSINYVDKCPKQQIV